MMVKVAGARHGGWVVRNLLASPYSCLDFGLSCFGFRITNSFVLSCLVPWFRRDIVLGFFFLGYILPHTLFLIANTTKFVRTCRFLQKLWPFSFIHLNPPLERTITMLYCYFLTSFRVFFFLSWGLGVFSAFYLSVVCCDFFELDICIFFSKFRAGILCFSWD